MKLSIIIVSYNVCSYLRQCLQSIIKSNRFEEYEIIIIDNYSHDDSCRMVENEYPHIKLIKNKENLGFSRAVNIGIENSVGEFICVLNPDTLLSDNTFSELLDYMEKNRNTGCIGPKILNPDGSLQLPCKRSFPNPLSAFFKLIGLSKIFPKSKYFGKYNLTFLDENKIHNVDAISGSFMLFPRLIVDKIGTFDESFFMYGEDLDFCHRIKQLGYAIIYNPATSIIHYKGESSKTAPYDMIQIFYTALHRFYNKYSDLYSSWKYFSFLVSLGISIRKTLAYLKVYSTRIISGVLDFSSILFSFTIAIYFWYSNYHHEIVSISTVQTHWLLILDFILCWAISSYWLNLYKKDYLSYGRSLIVVLITFFLSATSTYFISVIAYSRAVLFITFLLTAIISAGWRIGIYILYRYRKINLSMSTPLFTRRAAILGTGMESMRVGNLLHHTLESHFILMGFIDDGNHSGTDKFLGRLDDVKGLIKNHNINEIIIPENYINIRKLIKLLDKLSGMNVNCKLVPKGEKMLIGKGVVENLAGVPLLEIELPLFDNFHQFIKRSFDIFLSSILIFLSIPVHLYFLLLKQYDREKIWSVNGSQSEIIRYRSNSKLIQDISLLFMILNGTLSFVGSQIINSSSNNPQLIVKPGVTGLPHLKAVNIDMNYIRKFENYYAMQYSLIFDIEILLKSIFKI